MDDVRGALLPLAQGFGLMHRSQLWVQCHVAGRWVHVLGEELRWSLTPRRGDQSGPPNNKRPARNGFGEGPSNYPPYPIAVPPLPGSTWQAVSQASRACARERKRSPRSFSPSKDHGIFNRNTRCDPSSYQFFERKSEVASTGFGEAG